MLGMEPGSCLRQTEEGFTLTGSQGAVRFYVSRSRLFLLDREGGRNYVLPVGGGLSQWQGRDLLWILPEELESPDPAFCICAPGAPISISESQGKYSILIQCANIEAKTYENRPQCDFFGAPYFFDIPGGEALAKTLAAFYWDSMLPMVIEKTAAKNRRFSAGFVVSTLQKGSYAGTYPDVDHEFQIKGRLAMGSALDLDIVRRMMELQIDVMRRDPSGQWRNPCAVQPRGNREYHVPRRSKNLKRRAIMFLLTGNVEIIESAWLYYCRTKDAAWLQEHIEDFEHVVSLIEAYMDKDGRLWSDVYYEDQVIKDGRETIAQAFAANSLRLLSEIEGLLGRPHMRDKYTSLSHTLAENLIKPLPEGYWDAQNSRFVDWIDRKSAVHDHIHLLANELPGLFGYATEAQTESVERLLAEHRDVFWKFPSFVAAKIEDYTADEIGTGGPYDLCAAGRYWCWDAAYWHARRDCGILRGQLFAVAAQAKADGYIMGERYDMNYVYYPSDRNWHGAAHYYEYPNVFAWVLVQEYLGIRPHADCDFLIAPRLAEFGSVRFGGVAYTAEAESFTLANHGERELAVRLDLDALYPGAKIMRDGHAVPSEDVLTVQMGASVKLTIRR